MFDTPVSLKRGDTILLMTDGVYEFCPPGVLADILGKRRSCRTLAKMVTDTLEEIGNPEQDNASIIVARVWAVSACRRRSTKDAAGSHPSPGR